MVNWSPQLRARIFCWGLRVRRSWSWHDASLAASHANARLIDANNRRNLGASATHEYFICPVEFGGINLAFACDAAKLASCQLHDRLTRNPQQNILARSWGDQFTIDD